MKYVCVMIDAKTSAAVRAVVKYGNFRAAADALGTSPASFSRYISQAEAYAGHTLFGRGGKGASLTPAGTEFLALLDTLQGATNRFEAGVDKLRSGGPATLRIGCGPLTTRTIIAPLLVRLLQDQPDIRANIQVSATKDPLEALRIGALDVAICDLTHTPDLSDLRIQMIRREPVSFWARPEHALHGPAPVRIAEVFRRPFITAHLHRHWRAAIIKILGGGQEARKIVGNLPQIECDDFALLADLTCNADLICGGMHDAFARHAALGLLKEIRTIETLTWNICAARRKDTDFPALDQFWAQLADEFGP